MSGKDRRPEDDRALLVRDDDGGTRLVPGGNIVEGEMEKDDPPSGTSPSP